MEGIRDARDGKKWKAGVIVYKAAWKVEFFPNPRTSRGGAVAMVGRADAR